MRQFVTGFAGSTGAAWETPKKRHVGVDGIWENVRGRWVGHEGVWLRYWPPQLLSNGYCTSTYTSEWTGSEWGAAVLVSSQCGASLPGGVNVWVADGAVATGTFANAAGVGDFDCIQGGAACAGVPALPNELPPPNLPAESPCVTCQPSLNPQASVTISNPTGTWAGVPTGTFAVYQVQDAGTECIWYFYNYGPVGAELSMVLRYSPGLAAWRLYVQGPGAEKTLYEQSGIFCGTASNTPTSAEFTVTADDGGPASVTLQFS